MAKPTKNKTPKRKWQLGPNQQFVLGGVLMLFAFYVGYVGVSHIFTWATDLHAIAASAADTVPPEGKGTLGARLGNLLIGNGFGVFGLAIPVMLLILGFRLVLSRRTFWERSMRITLIVMILGSVSLGLAFGTKWGFFGTGLGGEMGIFAARWLQTEIGLVGSAIALIGSWILLAIYISRQTITVIKNAGQAIIERTGIGSETILEDKDYYEGEYQEDIEEEFVAQPDAEPTITPTREPSPFVVKDIVAGKPLEIEKPTGDAPVERMPSYIDPSGVFEVRELEPAQGGRVLGAGGVLSSDGQSAHIEALSHEDAEAKYLQNTLYDPLKELSAYRIPDPDSTLRIHGERVEVTDDEIQANSNHIVKTLRDFGIEITKIKATVGPTVTLYEIIPAPGVKISKIKGLEQDIALSLKALGIRIIAPIPGKGTIGIEVPNSKREIVSMHSLIKTVKYQDTKAELPLILGRTISNEAFLVDLAKMPHLLIAGATGQGKSVGLNVIISSLLYKKHPAEVKFVMVDPKKVELSLYGRLEQHFLAKMESEDDAILTDTQKVVYTLNSLCAEMESRYELLRKAEVRKISEYNEKFINRRLNPNKGHRYLPYIVVVIDEFADMIMTAGKEVEQPITRLAQLARATGIHLIIATQRPDVKVITGLIKANFPARIAFRVTSIVDSRTILDQTGANQLIGQGDMLISLNGELTRLQCGFIDTPELEAMTTAIQQQRGYPTAYLLPDFVPEGGDNGAGGGDIGDLDKMFEEVARFVVTNQQGSTSNVQRHFAIGYNRAGRLMDQLERAGIVGRAEGSKPREVMISDTRSLDRILEDFGVL
ncbi:MAG: DNA translocase FtsK [Rikenellaceae bacterium]|jgi:S-DNA-T family DNA segregation ATPase FtsK/SpoIIIE|nr:DNA translocase FtsK [Rikenellaceae bacterium]